MRFQCEGHDQLYPFHIVTLNQVESPGLTRSYDHLNPGMNLEVITDPTKQQGLTQFMASKASCGF